MLTDILRVAVGLYFLVALVLFLGWHSGDAMRTRVAGLLDSSWGWWLPFGLFWKWGRAGRVVSRWRLMVGALPFVVYNAGEQWTTSHGG